MLAAAAGREGMVRTLLTTQEDAYYAQDTDGRTALMLACARGHSIVVDVLSRHNPLAAGETCDQDGNTGAMIACEGGHYECMRVLGIASKSALDVIDAEGRTLAMRAVLAGQGEVALALLRDGSARVTDRDAAHNTVVMLALARGDYHLVTSLCADHGADITARDETGRTGFMQCIDTNKTACILAMLSLGVMCPGTRDHKGRTAIMHAAARGNLVVVRSIIARNIRFECDDLESVHDLDKRRWNALVYAAKNDHSDIVRCLVNEHGANVDVVTASNFTPLLVAASMGNTGAVRTLVLDCNADTRTHLYRQWSALVLAADGGHTETTLALVRDCGMYVNERNHIGWTPLMFSVYKDHTETVAALGACDDCDVNIQNDTGMTALMMAAQLGSMENIRFLCVECGADPNILDMNTRSALMLASELGKTDVVVALVMKFGANVDIANKHGYTALCMAAKAKKCATVRALVTVCGANTHVQCRNYGGFSGLLYTPSCFAAESGDLDSLRVLMDAKDSDIHHKTPGGLHIISKAAALGRTAVVDYLVGKGACVDSVDDELNTALMMSCLNGHIPTAYALAQKLGANVNMKNRNGNTAFGLACVERNYSIMTFLATEFGADPNAPVNSFGSTPLSYTIAYGSLVGILLLLDVCGVDVTIADPEQINPLMIASIHSRVPILSVLVKEHGILVNSKNSNGVTALIYAVMYGSDETVGVLLDLGADVEVKDMWGNSAVAHAIERKRPPVMSLMIETFMRRPLAVVGAFSLCLCEHVKMLHTHIPSRKLAADNMPGDIVCMIIGYYLESIVKDSTFFNPNTGNMPPAHRDIRLYNIHENEQNAADVMSLVNSLVSQYVHGK